MKEIRVGTRDSQLAVWQAEHVVNQLLSESGNSIDFEIVKIKSKGDLVTDIPLEKLEGKGFFTKELDTALIEKKIDMAVHSLKDIPTEIADSLQISAITQRHDPRDALVSYDKRRSLESLPKGATVATGSLRRRSQLLVYRPDLKIVGLRGNLQTRYKKLETSDWQGIILASAGIERLNLSHTISEKISLRIMLPAVGQGSLAIMSRKDDEKIRKILKKLMTPPPELLPLLSAHFYLQ